MPAHCCSLSVTCGAAGHKSFGLNNIVMEDEQIHKPVLRKEVLEYLVQPHAERIVDGTLGAGGHAGAILEACPGARMLGIERDPEMLTIARENLSDSADRVEFVQGKYSDMARLCEEYGWQRVDGVLLDLGVCSYHLDSAERGFAHRYDGPLDMRFDRRSEGTAAELLNHASEDELRRILAEYGEERKAKKLAKAIVQRREKRPWMRTGELKELVASVVGRGQGGGLPPATRTFQALRIAVNDELRELEKGLTAAVNILKEKGRLVVISFHSLEDRRVKRFFREEAASCVCPPEIPECRCGKTARLSVLTKKPVRCRPEEKEDNPRAGSARLRAAEKLPDER